MRLAISKLCCSPRITKYAVHSNGFLLDFFFVMLHTEHHYLGIAMNASFSLGKSNSTKQSSCRIVSIPFLPLLNFSVSGGIRKGGNLFVILKLLRFLVFALSQHGSLQSIVTFLPLFLCQMKWVWQSNLARHAIFPIFKSKQKRIKIKSVDLIWNVGKPWISTTGSWLNSYL